MTKKAKKGVVKKTGPKKGILYLTVQSLERAVKSGTKNEKNDAFEHLGYTVKESDGWVVKEYEDGRIEKMTKLKTVNTSNRLVLD